MVRTLTCIAADGLNHNHILFLDWHHIIQQERCSSVCHGVCCHQREHRAPEESLLEAQVRPQQAPSRPERSRPAACRVPL